MIAASRRSFITGLVALVAAPAIVRAGSLMPANSGLIAAPAPIRVWASNQSGRALTVEPLPSVLQLGDVITIDDVYAWYRPDNTPIRRLRQFVVMAQAEPGHRVVHLYPPIIGEHDSRHRTVVGYPMNQAIVRVLPRQHSAA